MLMKVKAASKETGVYDFIKQQVLWTLRTIQIVVCLGAFVFVFYLQILKDLDKTFSKQRVSLSHTFIFKFWMNLKISTHFTPFTTSG